MAKQYKVKEHYVQANGLKFCVQERGPRDAPPVIMVMGLAAQLTLWPDNFLNAIANLGYRVICFDNRDIGLSDKIQNAKKIDLTMAYIKYRLGQPFEANYTLYDMAEDTIGIMDALKLDAAHIVGVSMGGMIGQIVSAKYESRVLSLNLMMTSNNSPKQPLPRLNVIKSFLTAGLTRNTPHNAMDKAVDVWKSIQSSIFPLSHSEIVDHLHSNITRSNRPGGAIRQIQAVFATGSLHYLLKRIKAPTLVIHGEHDPLVHPINSKIIARKISNAKHIPVYGMGHDMPEEFLVFFADLIHKNTQRAAEQRIKIGSKASRPKLHWAKKQTSYA